MSTPLPTVFSCCSTIPRYDVAWVSEGRLWRRSGTPTWRWRAAMKRSTGGWSTGGERRRQKVPDRLGERRLEALARVGAAPVQVEDPQSRAIQQVEDLRWLRAIQICAAGPVLEQDKRAVALQRLDGSL